MLRSNNVFFLLLISQFYLTNGVEIITQNKFPFMDPTLAWDIRVDDLVSRLTLEEVVHMSVAQYEAAPIAVARLGVKPYRWINECVHGVMNHNATAFPQSLGLAATFSRELLYNISTTVSTELRAMYNQDVHSAAPGKVGANCFSPVINIMRHPLWGRNQETYGEDPYLSGELSVQFVQGLQGPDSRIARVAGGCKHFDAHNGPENIPVSRMSFNAKVSPGDWYMTYLPQFRTCVEAGSLNIMCSYNSINGIPSCANKELLTDILRTQWKFNGFVISDDNAIEHIKDAHKYVPTLSQAALKAVEAGCNIELTGALGNEVSYFTLLESVKQGNITDAEIRQNLKKPIYVRMRLGEFDPTTLNPYSGIDMSVVLSAAHVELATKAAEMSFVLLKNSNKILPIQKKFERLAVVGPFANNTEALLGSYAPKPDPSFLTTPLTGLRLLGNDTRYAAGCNDAKCQDYDTQSIENAVTGTQIVFVCLGTGAEAETEGNDRVDLELPGQQLQLLKDAAFFSGDAAIVLLLFNAGPLDITWAKLSPEVDVIMACSFPAMMTGPALYNVVTSTGGSSVPAARLPSTWPAYLHQVPPITDYNMSGFTYRYYQGTPLYPFGFGLSYSTFHYSDLQVTPNSVKVGGNVTVTISVLNQGPYLADEVTQVYMGWVSPTVAVPRWTLVGFHRQSHRVNEASLIKFTITPRQMEVWVKNKMAVLPGKMVVYVGGQQPEQRDSVESNVLQTTFTVEP